MIRRAESISVLLTDYENNQMTAEHVLDWVSQFDENDQDFILEELLHIFKQTYFSKSRCISLLKSYIEFWAKEFNYTSVAFFIEETAFLDLQPAHKSQRELLNLLDEILRNDYDTALDQSGRRIKRFLYLDDILATGGTIFRNLQDWFNSAHPTTPNITNYEFVSSKNLKIHVCLLCCHSWGLSNTEYRLIKTVNVKIKSYIRWYWFYEIQNNLKDFNQSLNHMLPIYGENPQANNYLNSLNGTANADRAYRPATRPNGEKLFSSTTSRNRLETIFLVKGIEVLARVGHLKVEQIRPLGYTVKSHRTFGLGTLFFTYRNIPNNCPIVFWWASNNWKPLFILKERGN